ncbi:SH3 domain-binding protein 2 [Biomphalaria glabrata]|nr:SH3 domain-binding protein 2 [Biomphalaria glabrata]
MTSFVTLKVSDAGISAQDIISLPNAQIKHGIIRRKNPTITFGKWPHRFIVLLRDSLYVYHDEKSKSQSQSVSLRGYNRVKRVTSKKHDWCFALLPEQNEASLKPEKFACVSDAERREWMIAIRAQLYIANNLDIVPHRPHSFSDEDEYLKIEESIYDSRSREQDMISSTSEEESSSDSDMEEKFPVFRKSTRSYSSPEALKAEEIGKLRMLAKSTKRQESVDALRTLDSVKEEDESGKKRGGSTKIMRIPSVPPRYSEVVEPVKKTETAQDPDYMNLTKMKEHLDTSDGDPMKAPWLYDVPPEHPPPPPFHFEKLRPSMSQDSKFYQTPPTDIFPPIPRKHPIKSTNSSEDSGIRCSGSSTEEAQQEDDLYVLPQGDERLSLEALCTVEDTSSDRDHIICQLQAKQLSGTYLIRRSRQNPDEKVLAYLTKNLHVKEFKIYSQGEKVFLKSDRLFDSIEDLLKHYTSVSTLPTTEYYLKQGYHTVH